MIPPSDSSSDEILHKYRKTEYVDHGYRMPDKRKEDFSFRQSGKICVLKSLIVISKFYSQSSEKY